MHLVPSRLVLYGQALATSPVGKTKLTQSHADDTYSGHFAQLKPWKQQCEVREGEEKGKIR